VNDTINVITTKVVGKRRVKTAAQLQPKRTKRTKRTTRTTPASQQQVNDTNNVIAKVVGKRRVNVDPNEVYTANWSDASNIPLKWPGQGQWKNWRVFTQVDATGNCMYDCLCRALNSRQAPATPMWTITKLRTELAECYTYNNRQDQLQEFLRNARYPGSKLHGDGLFDFIKTNGHYGTDFDLYMLFKNKELNVIPIVVQYNGPTKPMLNPVQWFPVKNRGFEQEEDDRRYVVLLFIPKHKHYELLMPETGPAVVPYKDLPEPVRALAPLADALKFHDPFNPWRGDDELCKMVPQ
jgi:hypothetical protein